MAASSYSKITHANGATEWGAFVDCGYGASAKPHPKPGDTITVVTQSREVHQRVVHRVVKTYASGVKVTLVPDQAVAAAAEARRVAKAPNSQAAMARHFDDVVNEGGEGFNPYR
ncbi:hypothetical protein [Klebsiella oxytoca]|uniref:hypothetical protein n=1 Tax=Klebsiella oxytoca TaxID=571 RepID=UPI00191B7B2F|nr:hypothetical protein [Klebsiella oxytoca]CAA0317162.1 Uncharacterised protein [Klebsiella oxytoca]